jgi:hypothetical protein
MRHPIQLDPSRAGKQAEDLQKKLRRLIIGQDQPINQIVEFSANLVCGARPRKDARLRISCL